MKRKNSKKNNKIRISNENKTNNIVEDNSPKRNKNSISNDLNNETISNNIDKNKKHFKNNNNKLSKKNEIQNTKKNKKISNEEPSLFEKLHNKNKKLIKFIILISFLIMLVILLISFFSWKNIATAIIQNTPSTVIDAEGNIIAEIGTSKITENILISDIPENLKNAYVSIEDQRFYNHKGIDIKRTGAATLSYIKNFGKATFGGSTITQQLVKNITGDNSNTILRKFNEWIKSFELELFLNKEEILEAYFNIIYTGPNIYGVASRLKILLQQKYFRFNSC